MDGEGYVACYVSLKRHRFGDFDADDERMYDIRGYLGKNLTRWLYFTTIFTGTCWAGLLIVGFTYCRPFETNWSIGNDFCTPMTMKVAGAVTALTITNDLFSKFKSLSLWPW